MQAAGIPPTKKPNLSSESVPVLTRDPFSVSHLKIRQREENMKWSRIASLRRGKEERIVILAILFPEEFQSLLSSMPSFPRGGVETLRWEVICPKLHSWLGIGQYFLQTITLGRRKAGLIASRTIFCCLQKCSSPEKETDFSLSFMRA